MLVRVSPLLLSAGPRLQFRAPLPLASRHRRHPLSQTRIVRGLTSCRAGAGAGVDLCTVSVSRAATPQDRPDMPTVLELLKSATYEPTQVQRPPSI